jgi:hypothetical protein
MRLDCALLCDAATVREGLLHILGGGVTRVNRPLFPAPLGIVLAVRVMIHPTETASEHAMQVLLLAADGERVADIGLGFGVSDPRQLAVGEEASLPIAIPLANVALPQEGAYSFELLIDGIHQVSVPFRAELVPPLQGPPGAPPPGAPPQPTDDDEEETQ